MYLTTLHSIRFIYLFCVLLLLAAILSCTEEKTILTPLPDIRPPVVEWVSVDGKIGSHIVVSNSVEIVITAFDESGLDSIRIFKNGFAPDLWRIASRPAAPLDDTLYTFTWNTLSDSDGVYTLEARAYDKAGNVGISPNLSIKVTNTTPPPPPDRTPPIITWLAPFAGSTVRDTVELCFLARDESPIDSLKIYIDGEIEFVLAGQGDSLYAVRWNSWRFPNGRRIVEIRAWDSAGNIGVSEPIGLTVDNHRVLWVPDDYTTIQGAINASRDGDTVRVRAGTYREGVRSGGRNIWLESENGPEQTIINGLGWNDVIRIDVGSPFQHFVIRGFTLLPDFNGIANNFGSSVTIYNCIIKGPRTDQNGIVFVGEGFAANCIIDSVDWGFYIQYTKATVYNCIIINCNSGYHDVTYYNNWTEYGCNLFWNNTRNYFGGAPRTTDIFDNPQFLPNSYRLSPNSPAIDAGNPNILDKNGTISDIGAFGGPYSYTNP